MRWPTTAARNAAFAFAVAVAIAVTACVVPSSLRGQAPATPVARDAIVLLRDPSGQPVVGAQGVLLLRSPFEVPALLDTSHRALPPPGEVAAVGTALPGQATGTSNARGELRFAGDATPRAGTAIITTAAGLGALVPHLLPGAAQRITLAPLGEVSTATGSEAFVLHAAYRTYDNLRIVLPVQTGTAVRLPAGSYEVWARSEEGWIWQRLDVAAGRRSLLHFAGPAQALRCPPGTRVHPEGWPEVELLYGNHDRCTLRGAALAAALVAHDEQTGAVLTAQVPGPPRHQALLWPPAAAAAPARTLRLTEPGERGATQLFVLRRNEAGTWRVFGAGQVAADGTCQLPEVRGGDDWLLALAPDRPVHAWPWHNVANMTELSLPRGVPLVVRCRGQHGDPAVDVRIEFEPQHAPVATVLARSDSRGHAHFGPLAAPGTLRVSDPRFANENVDLRLVPLAGIDLSLTLGAQITGSVHLPDGAPAAGTLVTLRDPAGRLRPAQRATVTAPDGTFTFVGLDEGRRYVLFANSERNGTTWSAKVEQVLARNATAEEPTVDLVIRSEDPVLGPAAAPGERDR